MNGQSLRASINQAEVGTLQEMGGLWGFQYAGAGVDNPPRFALSPHLPLTAESMLDGACQRPVQWYFDNLLPEEGQRVLPRLARNSEKPSGIVEKNLQQAQCLYYRQGCCFADILVALNIAG